MVFIHTVQLNRMLLRSCLLMLTCSVQQIDKVGIPIANLISDTHTRSDVSPVNPNVTFPSLPDHEGVFSPSSD